MVEAKFCLLVRHFALDLTASDTSQLTGLSYLTTNTVFGKIRQRIAEECEHQSLFKSSEVEVDESYFGPHRVAASAGAGRKTYCLRPV